MCGLAFSLFCAVFFIRKVPVIWGNNNGVNKGKVVSFTYQVNDVCPETIMPRGKAIVCAYWVGMVMNKRNFLVLFFSFQPEKFEKLSQWNLD